MPVLALDTATALTTVAVVSSSGEVLAEASHLDARRHAEVLPRLVREVLSAAGTPPAQLDLIAVGVGPGPFTGLRVGVTFARATAHALGIPAVGAMTLDVIARGHTGRDAGPFTVHFWAPMSKWMISGASFFDLNRPTDKISLAQYSALTLTGFFFSRYSLLVIPINYVLCSVNIALFGSSAWHLGRKINADYLHIGVEPKAETKLP